MKIGTLLMAGIFGVAVVAGVVEGLAAPRKKKGKGEEKKKTGDG
jgi:hypothetical protein